MKAKAKPLSVTIVFLLALMSAFALKNNSPEAGIQLNTELRKAFESWYHNYDQDRVYVHNDKSIYQAGETLWFTAYVRGNDLRASRKSDIVYVQLLSPKGEQLEERILIAEQGMAEGDFNLPDGPGGVYTIQAYTQWQKEVQNVPSFEKQIQIQKVVLPRVKMRLDLVRERHLPGENVLATVELSELNNNKLNIPVLAQLQLNGKVLAEQRLTTKDGQAHIALQLPDEVDGTPVLQLSFDYQGITESIARSVGMASDDFMVELHPESGYLIAGKHQQVAFRALGSDSLPYDFSGQILDAKGQRIESVRSEHDGMGAFYFTPKAGMQYRLQIAGASKVLDFPLPSVQERGCAFKVEQTKQSVLVRSIGTEKGDLQLTAEMRGSILFAAGSTQGMWEIPIAQMPPGVLKLTLFDHNNVPRAERMVFVHRTRQLDIDIQTNKTRYLPREEVEVQVQLRDELGIPIHGQLSLAVVDDNLQTLADDRQGRIRSKLLLEPDLNHDVHEGAYYFEPGEDKNEHLDLLMLTAGWRQWSWQKMRQSEAPTWAETGERSIISGQVLLDGKPVPGIKVAVEGQKTWTSTDKDGYYAFKTLKLYEPLLLVVDHKQTGKNQLSVSEYGTTHNIHLGRQYMFKNNRRNFGGGVPEMMDEVAVLEMDMMPMDDFEVMPEAAQEQAEAENEAPARDKLEAPQEGGMLDFIGKRKIMANEEEARIWPPRPPAQQSRYYRAQQFPELKFARTERHAFQHTVYWNGRVELDDYGKGKLRFQLNDIIGSLAITAQGIGANGIVGEGRHLIYTELPLSIEAKLPAIAQGGDQLDVPIFVQNRSPESMEVQLYIAYGERKETQQLIVASGASEVYFQSIQLPNRSQDMQVELRAKSTFHEDYWSAILSTVPKGFFQEQNFSGDELSATYPFEIHDVVPNTLDLRLVAYPSTSSELLSGIESILREPHGCFEQTSSSTYPNIMVLDYLRSMDASAPKIEANALDKLQRGYDKLVSFETEEDGYEWFGAAPGHEALTAYGLMEFVDMKKVMPSVDQGMIDRTANWLLSRRDGQGSFKRNARALDSYGRAEADITDAYIVYALTEAGYKDIAKEIDAVWAQAQKADDPYLWALNLNIMENVGHAARAKNAKEALLKAQAADGSWSATRHSITMSRGKALQVETTALAVLGLLKGKDRSIGKVIDKGTQFIVSQRSGGGFGCTQATILALKALTQYALFAKVAQEDGSIEVMVNGKKVASTSYEAGEEDAIVIENLAAFITPGQKQEIAIRFKGCKEALPYTLMANWYAEHVLANRAAAVELSQSISNSQLSMGDVAELNVELRNLREEPHGMVMALIGIPAGLIVQAKQLRDLQNAGTFSYYELIDNYLAVYYRDMAPMGQKEFKLLLKADVPGRYNAPPSITYPYYEAEARHSTRLAPITITK